MKTRATLELTTRSVATISLSLCRSIRLLSLAFRSFLLITSRVHRALYVRHAAGLTTLLQGVVITVQGVGETTGWAGKEVMMRASVG